MDTIETHSKCTYYRGVLFYEILFGVNNELPYLDLVAEICKIIAHICSSLHFPLLKCKEIRTVNIHVKANGHLYQF